MQKQSFSLLSYETLSYYSRIFIGTVVLSLNFPLAVQAADQVSMALPGNFSVTPAGAASYTIPLKLPTGVSGMEPNLSLSYNSRSGNGLLGVGWSLSGLSAIARCPQTRPQDNARAGITYTANDRFCLDGKRLMLSPAGSNYGTADTVYRKEIDDFTKVTAKGTAPGGGPNYFLVKTKDGRTYEYGNTTDSNITAVGLSPSVTRTWALNKIVDSKGNTLTITYTQDTTGGSFNGGYYPASISYTSNPSQSLTATSTISFAYDATRTDKISGYEGGYPFTYPVRLSSITTQSAGTNVFTYSFTYENGPASGRSRLTSIKQCGASGNCLPSTTLQYSTDSSLGINLQPFTVSNGPLLQAANSNYYQWNSLDIDGDGWSDLAQFVPDATGNYFIYKNNHDGTFTKNSYTQTTDTAFDRNVTRLVLDLNNDGMMDIVHIISLGSSYIWKSNGANSALTITPFNTQLSDTSHGNWMIGDITGDGLLDIIYTYNPPAPATSSIVYMYFNNGDGTLTYHSTDIGYTGNVNNYVMDINGDGKSDLVYLDSTNNRIISYLSNGDGTFTGVTNLSMQNSVSLIRPTDINGDGLMDLLQLSSQPAVYFSKGNGKFERKAITNYGSDPYTSVIGNGAYVQWGQYHGNNLLDFIHRYGIGSSTTSYVWKSNGDGSFTVLPYSNGSLGENNTAPAATYVEGDYFADGNYYTLRINSNTTYEIWSPQIQSQDLPISISNGAGKTIQLTNTTLPKFAGYTKSLANTPATVNTLAVNTVTPAMNVITDVKVSDAAGGFRETQYNYDSARFELLGRGFLGFNWMQSTEVPTGLVNRTVNNLNFPYIGLPYQTGKGTSSSSWNNLSLTTNTYNCFISNAASAPNSGCSVTAGNSYFVYPNQINTQPRDLNGSPLPQTTVLNQSPDAYGNIQTVVTNILNSDGSASGYSKTVTSAFYNDVTNWYLGRVLSTTTASVSPINIPTPVTPGSGGLAAAPAPTAPSSLPPGFSQIQPGVLVAILGLLLN